MRNPFALLVVLVAIVVVLCGCETPPAFTKPFLQPSSKGMINARHSIDSIMKLIMQSRNVSHVGAKGSANTVRSRRQSDACEEDLSQIFKDYKFLGCYTILGDFESYELLFNETISLFCSKDCGNYLDRWFVKLGEDCGPDYQTPVTFQTLMKQACKKGPTSQYCFFSWLYYYVPAVYDQCLNDFPQSSSCPTSCKEAEAWVQSHYGCCYRAFMDYNVEELENGAFFTKTYWTRCKMEEPKLC